MNKFIKLSLCSLVFLSLAGCSRDPIKPASVEDSSYLADNVKKEHFLTNNIEVKAKNFFFNNNVNRGRENRANLDNKNFEKALGNSLYSIGFIGNKNTSYTLEASLVDASLEENFIKRFENNREVNIVIDYTLTDYKENVVYEKRVSGTGFVNKGLFNINVYDVEKEAVEEAYRNNIKRLVEDLVSLESSTKENGSSTKENGD